MGKDNCHKLVQLDRRTALSAGVGAMATIAGFGALTGSAAAWDRFTVDFKGCSEVWIVVDEADLALEGLTATVVVADDGDAVDREVEITEDQSTTIPGQYGDAPILKYQASSGKKVLGVIGNTTNGTPLECETAVNDHRCAETAFVSIEDSDAYQNRIECQ